MKREKEKLTAQEYRRRAAAHCSALARCWRIIGKTGVLFTASVCVVVGLCLAWFASNDNVKTGAMMVQGIADGEFELAAAGTVQDIGAWDEKMPAAATGYEATISDRQFVTTGSDRNSIRWAITESSQMGNHQKTAIHPGSAGEITFYIVAKKSGPLTVTLDVGLTGEAQSEEDTLPRDALELLGGHVLLFADYDEERMAYGGWIAEDAQPWRITLTGDGVSSAVLERNAGGKLTWTADVRENTAYPITIYWIWPEVFGEYLFRDPANTGNRPLLFPEDGTQENAWNPYALPQDLFTVMCQTEDGRQSNKYFRWATNLNTQEEQSEKRTEFRNTVTPEVLSGLRTGLYNKNIYGRLCDYYNRADQYLGENIRYLNLHIDAQ